MKNPKKKRNSSCSILDGASSELELDTSEEEEDSVNEKNKLDKISSSQK